MDKEQLLSDIQIEFDYLKSKRSQHEADWKEAANYTAASIYNWDNSNDKQKRPERYTSKPSHFLETLVSGLLGYTISPNITWLKLSLSNADWLEYTGVKDWLETVEKILYAEFNRSNLYSQAPSFIRDAVIPGHGVMLIDEDLIQDRIRFSTRRTSEIYLDVNEYDEVDTVYRAYTMTVRNLVSFFGYENCDAQVQIMFDEQASKNTLVNVLHAVYPRKDRDQTKLSSDQLPIASVFVDLDHKHILQESGYYDSPYAIFPWSPVPGSGYSDSPAQQAMCDILLLNKAEEARLKVAQLSAEPPMNVPEKMRGAENVIPRGYNYFDKADQVMSPINTGSNFPINIAVTQDIEQRIKDWFHVDFFLMLQSRDKQITATEVVELQGEKAAVLSTLIINQNNALSTIIRRSFNILYRQGKIPKPPAVLADSGAQLKIDFVGPLAQAQKRYHQSGGISQSLAMAGPVLQLSPGSIDYIDGDKLLCQILDSNGYPQGALREHEEVIDLRKARVEMQAQQQQAAMQQQQGEMIASHMNKLNEPVKQGSVLQEMSKQMAAGVQR